MDLEYSLEGARKNKGVIIRLTAIHRVPMSDVVHLKTNHPEELMKDCGPDEFRSIWHEYHGSWISLVLVGIGSL